MGSRSAAILGLLTHHVSIGRECVIPADVDVLIPTSTHGTGGRWIARSPNRALYKLDSEVGNNGVDRVFFKSLLLYRRHWSSLPGGVERWSDVTRDQARIGRG